MIPKIVEEFYVVDPCDSCQIAKNPIDMRKIAKILVLLFTESKRLEVPFDVLHHT
jgi:hypothetical protein